MPDKRINADILLYEHDAIRAHLKLAIDLIRPQLQTSDPNSSPDSALKLYSNVSTPQDILSRFAEGLRKHLVFEEKALSELIGGQLQEPILVEHRMILTEMDRLQQSFTGLNAERPDDTRYALALISGFQDLVLAHCTLVDVILRVFLQGINLQRIP